MKAQLAQLKGLMQRDPAALASLENRRHFNRLLRQYQQLRAGGGQPLFAALPGTVVVHPTGHPDVKFTATTGSEGEYIEEEEETEESGSSMKIKIQRLVDVDPPPRELATLQRQDQDHGILLMLLTAKQQIHIGVQTSEREGHMWIKPPQPSRSPPPPPPHHSTKPQGGEQQQQQQQRQQQQEEEQQQQQRQRQQSPPPQLVSRQQQEEQAWNHFITYEQVPYYDYRGNELTKLTAHSPLAMHTELWKHWVLYLRTALYATNTVTMSNISTFTTEHLDNIRQKIADNTIRDVGNSVLIGRGDYSQLTAVKFLQIGKEKWSQDLKKNTEAARQFYNSLMNYISRCFSMNVTIPGFSHPHTWWTWSVKVHLPKIPDALQDEYSENPDRYIGGKVFQFAKHNLLDQWTHILQWYHTLNLDEKNANGAYQNSFMDDRVPLMQSLLDKIGPSIGNDKVDRFLEAVKQLVGE